jgi:hypothetical protein
MAATTSPTIYLNITTKSGNLFELRMRAANASGVPAFFRWQVQPRHSLVIHEGKADFLREFKQVVLWHVHQEITDMLWGKDSIVTQIEAMWLDGYNVASALEMPPVGLSGEGYHSCVCHTEVGPIRWVVREVV